MARKYEEKIYMGVAPTTHMHATNVTLNDGTSVQADSDAIHDYLNRKFELIEDITTEEEINTISLTDLSCTDAFIYIETPIASANGSYLVTANNTRLCTISNGLSSSTKAYGTAEIITYRGITTGKSIRGIAYNNLTSVAEGTNMYLYDTIITSITITSTINIPVGTNIKIYTV